MNINNILAAVFIATGQDVACIGESGSAQLMLSPASREEIKSQGMYSLSQTDRLFTFLLACLHQWSSFVCLLALWRTRGGSR